MSLPWSQTHLVCARYSAGSRHTMISTLSCKLPWIGSWGRSSRAEQVLVLPERPATEASASLSIAAIVFAWHALKIRLDHLRNQLSELGSRCPADRKSTRLNSS